MNYGYHGKILHVTLTDSQLEVEERVADSGRPNSRTPVLTG